MRNFLFAAILSVFALTVMAYATAAPGRHAAPRKMTWAGTTAWVGVDSFIGGTNYDTLHWTGVHLTSDTNVAPYYFVNGSTTLGILRIFPLSDTSVIVHTSAVADSATHLKYHWSVWLKRKH